MSKIVCDVCGTSFADSANQCPICGCAATAENCYMPIMEEKTETVNNGTYTYVKGGRFSKANVKKRNGGKEPVRVTKTEKAEKKLVKVKTAKETDGKKKKSNLGLMIAVLALFLVIVAVVLYITFGIFLKDNDQGNDPVKVQQTDDAQDDEQDQPEDVQIPCTELTPNVLSIELTQENYTAKLEVVTGPEDTTDVLEFKSSDETVVIVDSEGNVTAVGEGTAQIEIKCGDEIAFVDVTSSYVAENAEEEENEENAEENEEEQEQVDSSENNNDLLGNGNYKFNTYLNKLDFSLNPGESHELILRDPYGNKVEFTLESKTPGVCTVEGNVVTAVNSGNATVVVTATDGGNTYRFVGEVIVW